VPWLIRFAFLQYPTKSELCGCISCLLKCEPLQPQPSVSVGRQQLFNSTFSISPLYLQSARQGGLVKRAGWRYWRRGPAASSCRVRRSLKPAHLAGCKSPHSARAGKSAGHDSRVLELLRQAGTQNSGACLSPTAVKSQFQAGCTSRSSSCTLTEDGQRLLKVHRQVGA
jgi:hypothetical protein